MVDLQQLENNIINKMQHLYDAWIHISANPSGDFRVETMRIAISIVQREFDKVKNNEEITH